MSHGLPALSAESRLQGRLDELGTTASFVSALDGRISNTRLSQALRGLKHLDNLDAIRLLALTSRLIELQDALRPIPLSLASPQTVKILLEHLTATPDEIRKAVAALFAQ
jgi:hypothetical protein